MPTPINPFSFLAGKAGGGPGIPGLSSSSSATSSNTVTISAPFNVGPGSISGSGTGITPGGQTAGIISSLTPTTITALALFAVAAVAITYLRK